MRLTVVFLIVLGALYVGFVIVQHGERGGTTAGAVFDLEVFSLIAAAVALVGSLTAIGQAPRGVEVSERATVVVGRMGGRTEFPPLERLKVREVRTFRDGILSHDPVSVYELTPERGATRTVLIEHGIFDAPV